MNRVWTMQSLYVLALFASMSMFQFTGARKLWGSRAPTPNEKWRTGWKIDRSTYLGQDSVTAEPNPDGSRGKVNAIFLAQGSYSLTGPNSGTEFYAAPTASRKCLNLIYKVWFEEGFDFAYGGKLPGLYGGGVNCTAGTYTGKDCFTTRFIWRTGGAGAVSVFTQAEQTPGFCQSEDVECNDEWGHKLGSGRFQFQTGKWYTLQQTVRVNSPNEDGFIRLSIREPGKSRISYVKRNLNLRDSDILVDGIFFSNFFGGNSPCSASPVDTNVYFRSFILKDNGC